MNKKQLIVLILPFLFLTTNIYALSSRIEWNKLPVKKDIKHYENREYRTFEEYKQAYYDGKCSSMWLWMHIDKENKINLINGLKADFKEKDNVVINKPAEYYVKAIDEMIMSDPETQHFKLGVVFKTIAIIEYDFDEGIEKDETAKKYLGDYYNTVKEYREKSN